MSLHHLFACETRCNSVRGNTPYDEFANSPQQREPVTEWERHRNAAVFERQGNRNPSIDRPAPARSLVAVVAPLGSR